MKNIFNNQVVRMVRDEVNELRKKNKDGTSNQETSSSIPSAPPSYCYHPPSSSSTTDSYSHTANSTAGYSQRNTYPTLAAYNQEREKQVLEKKIIFIFI
jgi:hypothetical protein